MQEDNTHRAGCLSAGLCLVHAAGIVALPFALCSLTYTALWQLLTMMSDKRVESDNATASTHNSYHASHHTRSAHVLL